MLHGIKQHVKDAIRWIDQHPRTGWYVAVITTINVVLEVLQLLG